MEEKAGKVRACSREREKERAEWSTLGKTFLCINNYIEVVPLLLCLMPPSAFLIQPPPASEESSLTAQCSASAFYLLLPVSIYRSNLSFKLAQISLLLKKTPSHAHLPSILFSFRQMPYVPLTP